MMHPSYFMGIDGGGSKCNAIKTILVNPQNNILGQGLSGPENPLFGFKQAMDAVIQSAQDALNHAKLKHISLSNVIVGIGLTGINLPDYYQQASTWPHPFMQRYLTTDLHIACIGDHQGEDGAVIIVGTGSCDFSFYQGRKVEFGGYGFPHADKGSGAWFGLKAVSHTLDTFDGLGRETLLCEQLLTQFKVTDPIELSEAVSEGSSAIFASLAPTVFDCAKQGDMISINIVQEGMQYLSQLAKKLLINNQLPLALVGGLKETLLPWLDPFTLAHFHDSQASSEMGPSSGQEQSNTTIKSEENV
ncbi:BadF/BadG/BcrA/BcrD ATPase family protein [Shewanella surugensis]|uniref:ATPase n=1 Tax=Shewanella surugensis TaxID=212020 RepID=A0ABT0LD22_9GAMM|nr:BadF/BadG/BcrA/BcrD ATPase family protein [Shewanella surugensis]MCL1125606.1 ATPase [Shewanella surugensis]